MTFGLYGGLFKKALASVCFALVLFYIALLASGFSFFDYSKTKEIISSSNFRSALWVSFCSASLATFFALIVGIPTAYFLSRHRFPGKSLIDTILDLPTFLSPIATGTLLLMFFNTNLGRNFEAHGIKIVYTTKAILLAQFTIIVSLAVRLLKATFDGIPRRYEDLGRLLGCNQFQAFWKVALPMAKPGVFASVVICWARAFGEFGATVTLAGAMPGRTETIPIAIYLQLGTADLSGAVILIGVLVGISMVVLFLLRLLSPSE